MKWKKVYKIYVVSEEGLLKKPVFSMRGGQIFDEWYETEDEAETDIIAKSEASHPWVPPNLHIVPVVITTVLW
jgi:hypothetical protein